MINRFKLKIIEIFRKYSLPRWIVLFVDILAVFFSFLLAYVLRHNFELNAFDTTLAIRQAFFVSLVYLSLMLLFRSYSGLIRQTTVKDTFLIAITNTIATIVLVVITLFSRKFDWNLLFNVSLSILLIHFGAVTIFLMFFRIGIKMFYVFVSVPSIRKQRVLIYGSGETGIVVKRVIESDPRSGFQLKGFIDDNIRLQGKKVDGYPVFSMKILREDFIEAEDIKVFIFAVKNISTKRKKQVLETVIGLGLEVLETPSFDQWLNGQLQLKQLRKVELEDLLGREPISLDLKRIAEGLKNKTILVTGAAGSIGSEIVRQLTNYDYKQLLLVDQAETPSFYLNDELKYKYSDCRFELIIADVTNEPKMEHVFNKFRPEIIFHAAAYKHVPIMEENPHEAFRVNVGGTNIISDLAIKYKAEKFVMISSDKAVNPTSVMGATKKICELLVQAKAKKPTVETRFVTTRFGNVLGSSGSVIPVFKKQIAEGGPVTITDPEITRFFMTIPEACQLVLEAGFMGNGDEIYIFDMGKPIKILDVAIKLIKLSGLEPYEDIDIKFTGLRSGEKLYEELFSDREIQLPTHNPKLSIVKNEETDHNDTITKVNNLLDKIYSKTGPEVVEAMMEILPEYSRNWVINN